MDYFFIRLNDLYINLLETLSKINIIKLSFLTVIIELSVSFVVSFLLHSEQSVGPKFETKLEEFVLVVILAPLFETLIFQYSIISHIIGKRPNALLFACIVSAVFFGLSHFYSPEYIFKTFISGLLFGTLFLVGYKKNKNAFVVVTITHSIYNLTVFCLRQI